MSIQNHERRDMRQLPYEFDLLYDIKYMYEVEKIANDEPSHSDASASDLVELFIKLRMELPKCLVGTLVKTPVWLCNDGTWSFIEPLFDEQHKYMKAVIMKEVTHDSSSRVFKHVLTDVGLCKVVWSIKEPGADDKDRWVYYCDQWDNGLDCPPEFYRCSKSYEPEYVTKRPKFLPLYLPLEE